MTGFFSELQSARHTSNSKAAARGCKCKRSLSKKKQRCDSSDDVGAWGSRESQRATFQHVKIRTQHCLPSQFNNFKGKLEKHVKNIVKQYTFYVISCNIS